ncbi:MAG: LPS-assembly protein LptD [Gammaproteobacteria bacterium]|nr:LPS-assembly protein LptD [Gammaproteobacteria bacterium]MBU1624659.1 LPS-assembly protein LptD [Gammaproteobacteria bacterium]MBU1982503.1 LPS-assembly protein LptD [Gammaproteobacteria bacterium]
MLFRSRPLALFLLFTLPCLAVAETLPLKLDRTFKRLPPQSEPGVAFISADRLEARQGDQMEASGNVELRQEGRVVKADHLLYEQEKQDVFADGNVSIVQGETVMRGPKLKMNLDLDVGEMAQPEFIIGENNARGTAAVMNMEGRQHQIFRSAVYTTCPAGNDDWLIRMSTLELDRDRQVGVAYNARVEFKSVPFLYTPWMDFALNDDKRSGFLGPTFGSTNSGGSEITLPYFWNIAPNFDATIAPRYISKRGTQLNNEFRYLQPRYRGEIHADVLARDRVSDLDRSHFGITHLHDLGSGFAASVDANVVSDDAYYRDLAGAISGTSQANLLREGVVTYAGYGWDAAARVQRYQTLQDPLAPVAIPYRRQPQLTLNASRQVADSTLNFTSEYVDYRHPTLVNGQRVVLNPSISYALLNEPGYFLTPKLGLHYSSYVLDANNTTNVPNTQRTVPIFSVDSGLIFERNDSFLGNAYMQTLEPRAFYVRIPYRDQSFLPNFDSALAPFSFSQIFTENRFLGSDRVGDADMVTLALTSRVIDEDDGTERLRVAVAERFTLKTPQVNLGAIADSNSRSDILLMLGGRMTRAWYLDSQLQYNPNQSHTQTYSAAARYNPEAGKLLNLGYRYTRDSLRQMDLSGQWPLFGRWHGVGRFNYSLHDNRVLEALGGLEYNAACWSVRFVVQSFATATNERTTGIFAQLELSDLVRIGSDPLEALKISVPGYIKLNELPSDKPEQGLH